MRTKPGWGVIGRVNEANWAKGDDFVFGVFAFVVAILLVVCLCWTQHPCSLFFHIVCTKVVSMEDSNLQPATKRTKSTPKGPKKDKPAATKRQKPDSENAATQPQKKVRKPPGTTTPRKAAPRRKKPSATANSDAARGAESAGAKVNSDSEEEDSNAMFEDDGYGEEEEEDKIKELVAHFTAQQNDRYTFYRRSFFPKKVIKKVCSNCMLIHVNNV
jgi:hypothetical protein